MYNYSKFMITNREIIINVLYKKILLLERNNTFIDNRILIMLSNYFYHINLKHLLKINKINIIYKLDDIIFYDEHGSDCKITINSIIFNVSVDNIDFTNKIKQYSFNVPIFIIVKLENIDLSCLIKFKILKKGSILFKEYKVDDIKNKRLFEII